MGNPDFELPKWDPEEMAASFKKVARENEFIEKMAEVLTPHFPKQWIAIFDFEIIGMSPDREALMDEVRSKNLDGNPRYRYLDPNPRPLILPSENF